MATRTDIHRPGAIVPADYRSVMFYMLAGRDEPDMNVHEAVEFVRDRVEAGSKCFGGVGKCGVCGANFRYGCLFIHDGGDVVHMGQDCAQKYRMLADYEEFDAQVDAVRRRRAAEITARINEEERKAFLAKHPGLDEALSCEHHIVADIAARFRQYRTLSDKQVALVLKIADDAKKPKVEEKHVKAPLGRQTVCGTLVSRKLVDTNYGTSVKCTIKVATDDGVWLAWGTLPAQLAENPDLKIGDKVQLDATLVASDRNDYFVFMKRPTRGVVVPA